jgi:hypothetical protein
MDFMGASRARQLLAIVQVGEACPALLLQARVNRGRCGMALTKFPWPEVPTKLSPGFTLGLPWVSQKNVFSPEGARSAEMPQLRSEDNP